MAGWQRLKRSPIGLLPLGSEPMTIQRTRLERAILDAEATPLAIDWIGPREIEVAYRAPDPSSDVTIAHVAATGAATGAARQDMATPIVQVSHVGDGPVPVSASQQPTSQQADQPQADQPQPTGPVSLAEADRIIQWVLLALDRSHPEVAQEFRVEVPRDQAAFASLVGIAGVNDIAPIETITEGNCRFQLTARSTGGPIDTELCMSLTPHPKVATTRRVLPKGHRVSKQDLEMMPIPEEELNADHVLDPAEVVGMEVHGHVRPGQPLNRSHLGAPTLVRRGDLIEVRVLGGGVTVTTNAKSHGDGAASDLIEVETLEPRKRLLARVVQPGLVEIVTRAPRVQP